MAEADTRAETDVKEMLGMMDVVKALREQESGVKKVLAHDEQVDDLKRRLKATYETMGVGVDDLILTRAIEDYFSNKYEFQPPKRSLELSLAESYVDRGRLWCKYGRPIVVTAAVGGFILGVGLVSARVGKAVQESKVEDAVVAAYQEKEGLRSNLSGLSSQGKILPKEEGRELSSLIERAQAELQGTNSFFDEFCREGTAEDDVTQENYREAETQLETARDKLTRTTRLVALGRGIIDREKKLRTLESHLNGAIQSVRGSEILSQFKRQAEEAYSNGMKEVERRNIDLADAYLKTLLATRSDGQRFDNLSSRVENTYAAIQKISEDATATSRASKLYEEAKRYIAQVDVTRLHPVSEQLNQLEQVLAQDYIIRIVNRPGVNSGNWRYPTGPEAHSQDYYDQNPKERNHYLIVEAVGFDGTILSVSVTNEETGRTETVTMWGERVSYQAFERAKEDKKDNGHFDRSNGGERDLPTGFFGKKRRGHLQPELDSHYSPQNRQITQWETTYR